MRVCQLIAMAQPRMLATVLYFHACVPGGNSWILCTILYLVGPEGSMTRAVLVMRGEYRTVCFHPFISLD